MGSWRPGQALGSSPAAPPERFVSNVARREALIRNNKYLLAIPAAVHTVDDESAWQAMIYHILWISPHVIPVMIAKQGYLFEVVRATRQIRGGALQSCK